MKISLSNAELNKCKRLLETKELNIEAAEFYIDYLTNNFREIDSAKSPEDWFKKFNQIERVNPKVVSSVKMNEITELKI